MDLVFSKSKVAFALALLALAMPMQSVLPGAPAATAAAEVPATAPHHLREPVGIDLSLEPAPAVGAVSTLTALLTPQWRSLGEDEEVQVRVEAPPEVAVQAPQTVTLVQGTTTALAFDLNVLAAGRHRIEVVARRTDAAPSGEMGGDREAWLDVPESGSGAFHQDMLPSSPYAGRAVSVAATPLDGGAAAAVDPPSHPFGPSPGLAVGVPDQPLDPNRPSGETGDARGRGGPVLPAAANQEEPGAAAAHKNQAPPHAAEAEAVPSNEEDGGEAALGKSAELTGEGAAVIFSDAFNQASLDTSKWSVFDAPYAYGMASSSFQMTVQELGNNYGEIRSIAVTQPFSSSTGIDATMEMQRNLPGSGGWVAKPAFRILRSDNTNVWVEVRYEPWINEVQLRDSTGAKTVILFDTPVGYHTVRLIVTGSALTAYHGANGVTVSSTLFNGAPGFRVSLNDHTGGSSSGVTETSARRNLVVNNVGGSGPANDNFGSSVLMSAAPYSNSQSTSGATMESGEPAPCGSLGASVWYRYTPAASGTATVSTAGSNFDTVLAAYTGSSVGGLTNLACNDDSGGTLQSSISFAVTAGVTYRIQAAGFGGNTGSLSIALSCTPNNCQQSAPANNNFANSFDMGAAPYSNAQTTAFATMESGEPAPCGSLGASVWYRYTPAFSGTATVSTAGSNFDTVLAAYTGSSVGGLTNLACNDDSGGTLQSSVTFAVTGGTTYRIQAAGFGGATGTLSIALSCTPNNCQAPSPTFTVSACWFYEDEGSTSTHYPQRWAQWEVWDSDEGWNDNFHGSGLTDANGCFTSDPIGRSEGDCCNRGNQDIYVRFELCNGGTCVRHMETDPTPLYGLAGPVYAFETDVDTVDDTQPTMDFGNKAPESGDAGAGRIFQYLNNAWAWASGYGMSEVTGFRADAVYPCNHGFICPDGTSFYALPSDAANLASPDTMYLNANMHNNPDGVVHEWGHFVMDRAYDDNWPTDDPYVDHNFCSEENLEIAFQEGFADFIGARMNKEFWLGVGRDYRDNYYSSDYRGTAGAVYYGMESWQENSASCSGRPSGDDNEGNIAMTFWDLADTESDGLDAFSPGVSAIYAVMRVCAENNFDGFYNDGDCNWVQQGQSACAFDRIAYHNLIDYNDPATATVTSQSSFGWYSGTISLSGSLGDPEGCTTGNTGEFRISHDSLCTSSDTFVGTDTSSPYAATFNTVGFSDDASVWTCMVANDGMEWGPWDASTSSIGIDNTAPTPTATHTCNTAGSNGWCRGSSASVTLTMSDATSGLASSSCVWDGSSTACGTSTKTFQGTKTGSASGTDLAGNSASASTTVRIDGVGPSVSVSVPSTGAGSYTVSWSASDSNSKLQGTLTVAERNVDLGGSTVVCSQSLSFGQSSTSGSCTRGTTSSGPTLPGRYCYSATVTDVAGNTSTSTESCITKV